MDIRVIKSNRKIIDAFIELRRRKPIEKISVTELCKLAGINKSTFYAHYNDIYDLSDTIETRIVEDVVSSIEVPENILENPNVFTKELFYAYMDNEKIISVIFSGSRAALLPQKTEYIIKKLLFKFHPEYEKAASILKSENLFLAKVDATVEKKLSKKFEITGFPALKLFIQGKPIEYNLSLIHI